jgi:hypothetical protein
MPKRKTITADTMLALGRAMPSVEESTMYGEPALKLGGQMFACVPSQKSAEPNSLVIRMDVGRRDELIAADPWTYYLKDHYLAYPCVLVRLDRLDEAMLGDLLLMGRRHVASRPRRARRLVRQRAMRPVRAR